MSFPSAQALTRKFRIIRAVIEAMSKFPIEVKKRVREAVLNMHEALQPICAPGCDTGAMADAMEWVDEAALAIYEAHDMMFIRCRECGEDELVELAFNGRCHNCMKVLVNEV